MNLLDRIWENIIVPLFGICIVLGISGGIIYLIYNTVLDKIQDNKIENANEKIDLQDYAGAIEIFNEAIESDADNYRYYRGRGRAKRLMLDNEGALADFQKAVELNPHADETYYMMGNLKNDINDFSGAIADYTKAIDDETDDEDKEYYNMRGIAKYRNEDYWGAAIDFTVAIENDPDFITFYENRGFTFVKLNRLDSACLDFSKVANARKSLSALDAKRKYCK